MAQQHKIRYDDSYLKEVINDVRFVANAYSKKKEKIFMSKFVSLSFDDARYDTYKNAVPILDKYGLKMTLNVITEYITEPDKYNLACSKYGSMSVDDIIFCEKSGHEIAAHGRTHKNSPTDIVECVQDLHKWGISTENIGFASPHSQLIFPLETDIKELLDKKVIKYVRTGIQTRREGIIYSILTFFERKIHSRRLFFWLNKRCIFTPNKENTVLSVTVTNMTTVDEIMYFISKMKDNEAIIFNFHSILNPVDDGYCVGTWYWACDKFELLCSKLNNSKDIEVQKTIDLVRV